MKAHIRVVLSRRPRPNLVPTDPNTSLLNLFESAWHPSKPIYYFKEFANVFETYFRYAVGSNNRRAKIMSQSNPVTDIIGEQKAPVQLPLGLIRRFSRERKGSVAIEFSILAMPFIALIFAILESCVSFATQQLIANSADRVSRDVRTGRLKVADLSGTKLHKLICDNILLMAPANCPDLIVDLNNYSTFALVPKKVPLKADGDINQTGFTVNPGGPSTINHLRVYYRWPVMTDFMRSRMSNMPGGKTLLMSSATWRNEPFDL